MAIGAEWPIVGRDAVVDRIVTLVQDPGAAGVELVGVAGVGKSTVAASCADQLRRAGGEVSWITGTPALRPVPFGAFASLVASRSTTSLSETDVVGLLLDRRDARGPQPVLVADDAQWLDPDSAELLRTVAAERSLGLIVAHRTALDEVARPFDDTLVTVEIDSLGRSACDRAVRAALGGRVDPVLLDWVWELTEGVALYVRELITAAERNGSLTWDGDWWTYDPDRFDVGDSLIDLLHHRLDSLGTDEREAVELVAIGDPLPTALLVAATGHDVVARLPATGLTTEVGDRIRLTHPLYGEIIRSVGGTLRRRHLVGRLVDSSGAVSEPSDRDRAQQARWQLEIGRLDPAEALALAPSALAGTDYALAEQLATIAVAAEPSHEAWMVLGQARYNQSHLDEAHEAFRSAEDAGRTDQERLAALSMRFAALAERPEESRELLDAALAAAPEVDTGGRRWFGLHLGWNALALNRGNDALAAVAPLADEDPDDTEVATVLALAAATTGQFLLVDELRPLLGPPGHAQGVEATALLVDAVMTGARSQQGEIAEARAAVARIAPAARAAGPFFSTWTSLGQAWAEATSGDFEEALTHFRVARRSSGTRLTAQRFVEVGLLEVGVLRGDERLTRLGWSLLSSGTMGQPAVHGRIARADAWQMQVRGDGPAERAERLRRSLSPLLDAGQSAYVAEVYDQLGFLGEIRPDEAEHLAEISARMGGRGRAWLTEHGLAVARRDGPAALGAAEELEALGMRWHAACAYDSAARLLRTARGAGAVAIEKGHRLGLACGVRPELVPLPPAFSQIGPRPRAVLHLRAAGRPTADIADQLGISASTVANMMDRAADTVGATGRADLLDRWEEAWAPVPGPRDGQPGGGTDGTGGTGGTGGMATDAS